MNEPIEEQELHRKDLEQGFYCRRLVKDRGIPIPGSWEYIVSGPRLELLPGGVLARLTRDFVYVSLEEDMHIAHRGMIFDGGTIPRLFRWCKSPFSGLGRYAYVIHDWDRKEAHKMWNKGLHEAARMHALHGDDNFGEMLRYLGVNRITAQAMYGAVRIGSIVAFRGGPTRSDPPHFQPRQEAFAG